MKYSNTLTTCGEHDNDQHKGEQMRNTQTDCSVSFKFLHTAYRTTATEMLRIYSIKCSILHSLHGNQTTHFV